jgi:hypothetical protein
MEITKALRFTVALGQVRFPTIALFNMNIRQTIPTKQGASRMARWEKFWGLPHAWTNCSPARQIVYGFSPNAEADKGLD